MLTIAHLTIREGQRRLIVRMALIMSTLFLLLFGLGLHYIFVQFENSPFMPEQLDAPANFLTMAGLYVVNFLVIIMAVLISVGSISQEIDTHVMDTMVTKPVRRADIVLGKWLGFAVMIVVYTFWLAGGVMLISYLRTGWQTDDVLSGIGLISLSALTIMTVSIAGGTRLSTLANGVLAFMLYGLAFIGGWVETIGSAFRNETAVNLGIISSLIMPIEALWKKAAVLFQPRMLMEPNFAGPFVVTSEPSDLMVWYAVGYVLVLLVVAVVSLSRRDL